MNRNIARVGWIISVVIMATVACTCGLLPGPGKTFTGTPLPQSSSTVPEMIPTETLDVSAEETENAYAYATSMALASEVAAYTTPPEDIPVYEPNANFSGFTNSVLYDTSDDYAKVLEFYKQGMPAQGWTEVDTEDTLEREGAYANLFYTKGTRQANVILSAMEGNVLVMISIIDAANP
jgi:hypothetical protein